MGVASAVVQQFRRSGDSIQQIWTVRDSTSTRDADLHDRLVNNDSNPRLNLRIAPPYPPKAVMRDSDRFRADCPHWAGLRKRLCEAGLGASIGAGVQQENGGSLAIVLHRHYGDHRVFSPADEQFLLQLLPHIENAVNLCRDLERQRNRTRQIEKIADQLDIGILTFDHDCNINWANDAAQDILRRSSHLRAPSGRLCTPINKRNSGFEFLLRNRATSPAGITPDSAVLGADEDDELHVLLLPPASDHDDAALLMSEPRRSPATPLEDIARILRVTPAEARVAAALCAGSTLKEYAQSRGISEGSARNQLKQVLAKTDTRRQSELVGYLSRSVIFQSRSPRGQLTS
jgi:DNA-binding CsgD family transcriptional regulator